MPPAPAASGYAAVIVVDDDNDDDDDVDDVDDDNDDGQPGPPPGPGGHFLPVSPSLLLKIFFISFFFLISTITKEFCLVLPAIAMMGVNQPRKTTDAPEDYRDPRWGCIVQRRLVR
jgi:hypothetical protein